MQIEKYIRYLLFEHDCVVIPEFGGFIANYVPADIHPIRHTFVPPSKNIAFNEMLRLNDGLLVAHISTHEGVSREEAAKAIRDFVETIKEELRLRSKFQFEEIGTLFLNQEQKMQFEPENKVNYLNDSFGLPELRYTPIDRAPAHPLLKTKDRPAAMQNDENLAAEGEPVLRPLPKKRNPSVGRLVLIAAVLLFSGIMGMFYFADKNHALSSFNPFPALFPNWFEDDRLPVATTDSTRVDSTLGQAADLAHPDTNSHEAWGITPGSEEVAVSNEEPQPVAETPVADNSGWSNPAPEPAPADNSAADELVTGNTGRFYIIVAGFADRKGASRLKRKLEVEGQSGVRILLAPTGNRYKVSYADFENAAEANAQVENVRGQFADAWVMKY